LLGSLFSRHARPAIPPSHLREGDVLFVLGCKTAKGATESKTVGDPAGSGPYATFTFRNGLDAEGKTFELDIVSRQPDGQEYKSSVRAERIGPGVLDIKSIVFDNEPEVPRHPKEIYSVLNALGKQERSIFFGHLPAIHEDKGEFSKFGRFMTRHLPSPKADF
jgi:hypothetical protein